MPSPSSVPDGIVTVQIDPLSGMPATPMCPETRAEVYIAGTQPVGACPLHGGGQPGVTNVAGWDNSRPSSRCLSSTTPRITGGDQPASAQRRARRGSADRLTHRRTNSPRSRRTRKKGFFRRLWGVFK